MARRTPGRLRKAAPRHHGRSPVHILWTSPVKATGCWAGALPGRPAGRVGGHPSPGAGTSVWLLPRSAQS